MKPDCGRHVRCGLRSRVYPGTEGSFPIRLEFFVGPSCICWKVLGLSVFVRRVYLNWLKVCDLSFDPDYSVGMVRYKWQTVCVSRRASTHTCYIWWRRRRIITWGRAYYWNRHEVTHTATVLRCGRAPKRVSWDCLPRHRGSASCPALMNATFARHRILVKRPTPTNVAQTSTTKCA